MEKLKDKIKRENFGYITQADVAGLIAENRFYQVLVKCGGGRFTCSVQDLDHFTGIIGASESEYVRDVSFLAD
jgi:hypothetical protein